MAFIEKKDPIVLNIKLTSKGRELLSKGQLNFKYYAVGDSEIDYDFNRTSGFNPFHSNILKPADKNPQQLSHIPRNLSGDPYNEISAVPSTPTTVVNHVQPIGFFNNDATKFLIDTNHVKQPDIVIAISGVTGGTKLLLQKAPTYQANPNEPTVNDLLLVKWTNPLGISTTGYTINKNFPTPYLWYKIQKILSGTLTNDNLIVEVDREVPNFSGITGGSDSVLAGAMIFYNYINYTGDTCYSTDKTDKALIAFLQNCQCPTVTFPFWNMSIVFTENIVGVDPTSDKSFGDYNTKGFGGFVSYIQNQAPIYKKLGIIHYTNNSVSNTYGEGFYGDPLNVQDATDIPTLDIPTIMWHKSTGNTLGLQLKATGSLKYLTGTTKSLNTRYYDLADSSGNIVGKVFYDLKIFVIEDQELLFAMSYKSNRSWTLPEHNVDINANVTFGCPDCLLSYDVETTSPTTLNGVDGTITIKNIKNSSLDSVPPHPVILEILSGDTGSTGGTKVYFNEITGDTTITNSMTLNGFGLSAGTYTVNLIDTGFVNCIKTKEVVISEIETLLSVFDQASTYSGLNPYFKIQPLYPNNPTTIRFYDDNPNSIGFPLGTAYITITTTGTTNTELNGRTTGSTGFDTLSKWVAIPNNGNLTVAGLTFSNVYQIIVRDATGNTFSDIMSQPAIDSQIWTYYVAVGDPFNNVNNMIFTTGSDTGGTYVTVSNYLDSPLNPSINPVVGEIEISIYDNNNLPTQWVSAPSNGAPVKIYYSGNISNKEIKIRERFDYISMYERIITQII